MTLYAGSHGSIYVDSATAANTYDKPIAKVKDWKMSMKAETLDATSLNDLDRVYLPGLRSYTGSASFFYYTSSTEDTFSDLIGRIWQPRKADSTPDDDTFDFKTSDVAPTPIGLKLYMGDNNPDLPNPTSSARYIQVKCIVTEMSIQVNTGELTSGSMSFQVVGAPQRVVA